VAEKLTSTIELPAYTATLPIIAGSDMSYSISYFSNLQTSGVAVALEPNLSYADMGLHVAIAENPL
jgi:hypothetical protein